MRHLLCLVVALALAGCTTNSPSVPENYSGPLAQLNDSARTYSTMRADLFFVEELNGVKIDNSLEATRLSNQGRGMVMTPAIISRPVVAEETLKVGVKGRTHFAAPILAMAGTVYQVKGVVAFLLGRTVNTPFAGSLGRSTRRSGLKMPSQGNLLETRSNSTAQPSSACLRSRMKKRNKFFFYAQPCLLDCKAPCARPLPRWPSPSNAMSDPEIGLHLFR